MTGARPSSEVSAPKERVLPKKRNPLLAAERTPEHAELAARRRLGQTNLSVKPGQVGTSNATKPENLGVFDYAHLRAPLPDNLRSSEIFAPQPKVPHPGAYFLMRRSSDGFVSATGMFKASFPWAKHGEEQAEREYLKTLSTTSHDEIAGNIWIPEVFALTLADEYGILPWVKALVDDSPVLSQPDDGTKPISPPPQFSPPPRFKFSAGDKLSLGPPGATPARSRGRPRAASPTKSATPSKPMSPRKQRVSKTGREANAAHARQASDSLQASLDSAASVAETESMDGERGGDEAVNGELAGNETVTVKVDSAVEVNGDVETTRTAVRVEMPAHSPKLALPETTADIITKAKEMVAEARRLEGEPSHDAGGKRKATELDDESDPAEDQALQPAKKARLLEQDLRKQKVRNRALFGVAATLALGSLIPYVFGA